MCFNKRVRAQSLHVDSSNSSGHNVHITGESESERPRNSQKLVELSAETDPGQKPTFHQTDKFRIENTVNTWAEISPSSVSDSDQHCHISVELDFYSMIDLVSVSFVKFLGLSLCTKIRHHHVESTLKEISQIQLKIYEFYHLRLHIMNHWNHFLEFIYFFLTVDHNFSDSQILLERSMLKNFRINVCNDIDSWKFEHRFWVTKILPL